MRVVGAFMFLIGSAGAGYATSASFARRRPLDVAFGLAAPVALALALLGLTLVFVPGFF
jgi:hypothetical protein